MSIINLVLSILNQNDNVSNTNTINIEESNNNLIKNINDNIAEQPKKSRNEIKETREQRSNSLVIYQNQINGEINSINSNAVVNDINKNINISSKDNFESLDKNIIRNDKKKNTLSKKNMDIFAHLIISEQKKILSYYRNPVLFIIKKMLEGIIFHNHYGNNEEEENNHEKNLLSNIEENNNEENKINENSINENYMEVITINENENKDC